MLKNRIIWLVAWILSLVGITFYGGAISYGFFYIITFIPIVSLLYLLYVYICFRIYEYTDGRDFVVNDAIPYSFKLINEFFLPFVGIRVRFFEPFSSINELSDLTEYELMPKTGITRETTLVCHYRGEYEIGIKEVEVQDYFRLLKIKYKNRECRRVTVDPQLIRLENLGSFEFHAQDTDVNPTKLDIVSREYMLGDDVRFINWNQTARTNTLMTREKIGEDGDGVSIIMDACRYSDDPHIYLPVENKVLELTIAISLFFCEKGIVNTEYHYSKDLVKIPVNNRQSFENYYRHMASVSFDAGNAQQKLFDSLLKNEDIMHSALIYMVLPVWSDYADKMLINLAQRNIRTIVYLISEEEQKPTVTRQDLVKIITIAPEDKLEEVLS